MGLSLQYVDCVTSQVSTSPRLSRFATVTKMLSRQRVWCRGVPTLLSHSMFLTTIQVRPCWPPCLVNALPLSVNIGASDTASLDLSKAAKLQDLVFLCGSMRIGWIHAALRTVKSTNLERIAIYIGSPSPGSLLWDTVDREWRDLDQVLVQLWTSHLIRTKIVYVEAHTGGYLRGQLSEVIERGLVDLVQR